jgi:tRNA dimethylallyltransferase
LLAGRTFSTRGDDSLRKQLEEEFDNTGGDAMLKKLREVDEERAAKLHSNDKKRIIRSLEAFAASGKTISDHDAETGTVPPRYNAIKIALTFSDRAELYARINRRFDGMILRGLVDEVKSLLNMGVYRNSTSMQAIGYKEISAAILDCYDLKIAEEKVKMESRRYAKRQLTWLRRDDEVTWLSWESKLEIDKAAQKVMEILNETK